MSQIEVLAVAPAPQPHLHPPMSTTTPPTTSPSAASDPIPSTPDLPPAMLEKASSPLTAMPTTPLPHAAPTPSLPISPKWTSPRRAARMAAVTENAEAGPSNSPRPSAVGPSGPGDIDMTLVDNTAGGAVGPKFLQPDSFYPLHNGIRPSVSSTTRWQTVGENKEELSPEDDPLALRGIPIFRPTMEEFKDFEAYVERTAPWGNRSGIVKIIPPSEWIDTLPPMDRANLSQVKIKNPIQQNMMGTAGIFRATNIEKNKNKPLSVKEWFDKCQSEAFVGPSPRVIERDSKEAQQMRREAQAEKKAMIQKKKEDRLRRKAEREAVAEAEARASETPAVDDAVNEEPHDTVPALDPSSSGSSHSSPERDPRTPPAEQIEPWYLDTDLSQAWLPKNTSPEDYTPEACKMLQDKFWKNMGLGEPSWYGADLMQGSLFAEKETPWNVAHLPNLLNRIQGVVPGVNEPYLYFGMWAAQFAWHVEDMDLFSINYIHFGAPKFWYAIPQGQADLFERRLKDWFPQDAQQCDQFLRHKSCAISPTQLERNGIRANMLVHNQGEFVITYPRGYHAGFNMGFNCAESVNFALDSWIELGRKARYCQCVDHSVRIDVDKMLAEAADAVAQPESKKRKRKEAAEEGGEAPKKRGRKKKIPEEHYTADGVKIEDINAIEGMEPRPKKVRIKLEDGEEKPKAPRVRKEKVAKIVAPPRVFPCLFCPNMEEELLVPVLEFEGFEKSLSKGREAPFKAHTVCAQAIPEVGIEEVGVDGKKSLQVVGLENIEKARWALKCAVCHDKSLAASGVKVQCTKGKCPRAFHPSCAQNSDEIDFKVWAVEEEVPNPVEGALPAMIAQSALKIHLLCPQHNPAMKDIRERKKAEQLKAKVMALLPGSLVKIRQSGGTIYQMKLVAVREDTRLVEVELDGGQTGLVPWDKIEWKNVEPRTIENEYARAYVTSRKNKDDAAPGAAPPTTQQSAAPIQQAARQAMASSSNHLSRPFTTQPFRTSNGQYSHSTLAHSGGQSAPALMGPPQHAGYAHERQGSGYDSSSRNRPHHPHESLPPLHRVYPREHAQSGYPGGFHRSRETSGSSVESMNHHSPYYPPHTIPSQAYPPPHRYPSYTAAPHPYPITATAAPLPYGYHAKETTSGTGNPPPAPNHHPNPSRPNDTAAGSGGIAAPNPSPVPTDSSKGVGKIDLGLARMTRLMSLLPPLTTPAIHLAGTNGKGSVTAFLASMLRSAHLRVATYNSPFLIEPRDAITIDGSPPSRDAFLAARAHVAGVNATHNIQATTFELVTAAAFFLIQEAKVDVMIVECGMGGATDATNVLPPEIVLASGLTAVGLDHTSFLGDTVGKITRNKAGIAVKDGLLVVGPQNPLYPGVIPTAAEVASSRGARLIQAPRGSTIRQASRVIPRPFSLPSPTLAHIRVPVGQKEESIECEISLPGDHQIDNLSTATCVLVNISRDPRALSIQPKLASITTDHVRTGSRSVAWRGRLSWSQWRDMQLLIDGAHNADSASTLRSYLDRQEIQRVRWIIGLSASADKTPESVLQPLLRAGDEVWAVEFGAPVEDMPWIKAVPISQLSSVAKTLLGPGGEGHVHVVDTVGKEGLRKTLDEIAEVEAQRVDADRVLTVICGSLYLVADFYRLVASL